LLAVDVEIEELVWQSGSNSSPNAGLADSPGMVRTPQVHELEYPFEQYSVAYELFAAILASKSATPALTAS
jgi:hypothetical protein